MRESRSGKMRIAMIGHKRVPSREGGVEIAVWELAKRFLDRGFEVDCYNRSGFHLSAKDYEHPHGKKGNYCEGIRIITVPTLKNTKLNAIIYSVLGTIRALFGHYDVIHYHAEGPCLMLWLPRLFGIRTVATIHGLDWQRAKWGNFASRMLLKGESCAARYADEIIVLSKNMQNYFAEKYSRDTNYIPNGQNVPKLMAPSVITQKYGLNGGDYVLTLSRLVPEKGLHYLLEAFSDIDTDMKLVIAGGSGGAEDYADGLRRMGESDGRVIFTGFVDGDILGELLSNAAVFCQPSDVEGMAFSLLEALTHGRCCLVSDIPENREVVMGADGRLKAEIFSRGDTGELGRKLGALIKDSSLRERMGAEAAEYAADRFNWDRIVDETEKLYRGGL